MTPEPTSSGVSGVHEYAGDDFYCDVAIPRSAELDVVHESPAVLAFHHTRPYRQTHIVVVPKRHIRSLTALTAADEPLIRELLRVVRDIAARVETDRGSASVVTNIGAAQDSKHLHVHVLSGSRVQEVVGAVILDERQRAFIQRRSAHRRLFPNTWDIVGGHVEPGETPEEALSREVAEETGWQLREIVLRLGECTWLGTDGETRHERDYLITIDGDLDKPELEWDKHPEYRWISADEIDVLLENREPGDVLLRDILANAFRTIKSAGLP